MRIVGRVLLGLVVLVAGLAAVGMVLPRTVTVTRAITIDAPPEAVFVQVNALKAAEGWSPWLGRDPNVALSYSGPDEGVGNRLAWQSDNPDVGNGTQEIIESDPPRLVVTELNFGDMGTSYARFDLVPAGAATDVTWGLEADMGAGPIGRWMGLMMDGWVGGDYEQGLQNLKGLVEAAEG